MKRELKPAREIGGVLTVPGDKSIAHRAVMLSLLAEGPITIRNFPQSKDCLVSLNAARTLGVRVEEFEDRLVLRPVGDFMPESDAVIECANSGTTARLLAGLTAGTPEMELTLSGDESLSARPMKRIIEPLTAMGAECFDDNGHLPLRVRGKQLLPFEYQLPVPSAQVKSALLLAGMASSCSVTIREKTLSRDHTELMIAELGEGIEVRRIKPELAVDPVDPRKKRMQMPEPFKKEIVLSSRAIINGGLIDIPGDISTAACFFAAAAVSKDSVTVKNVGLNNTRTGFLDYLRSVGARVEVTGRSVVSSEPRGTVTVTGGSLKGRSIKGETTVGLIDEIPLVAVVAAFSSGTTVIRGAGELRFKESDRLQAISQNLHRMGVKCGLLEDGLAIEGKKELSGADFLSFGDHRIAMALSVAALFAVGSSTIDDDTVVDVSCPGFYELLSKITAR